MSAVRSANLVLRFALELATLAALAVWGAEASDITALNVLLAIAAPVVAATVWGLVVSPRARVDRGPIVRVAVELAVFASGVVALLAAGREGGALALGSADLCHLALYHATERTATSRPRPG